jgi:hypothetical protein
MRRGNDFFDSVKACWFAAVDRVDFRSYFSEARTSAASIPFEGYGL